MNLTKNLQALLTDAEKSGYTVVTEAHNIDIIKKVGRWKKTRGLRVFEGGWAQDLSVELHVAKMIRSYADMRKVLEI